MRGDTAESTGTPARTTATVDVAITVGEIDFGSSSNITIDNSNSGVLTLDGGSGNAIVNDGSGSFTNSGADTISVPLVLASPLAVSVGSSNNLTISGGISDAGSGPTKDDTGTLTLSGATGGASST